MLVNLPIRGKPGCYSRQLAGEHSVGKGKSAALCELWESPSSSVCLPNAKSSYRSCPVLVCFRAYFGILIGLSYKYILLGESLL